MRKPDVVLGQHVTVGPAGVLGWLSLVAASAGGVVRAVLIAAVPPAAVEDWRYVAVALVAGVVVLLRHSAVERLRNPVQLFDAAGLAPPCCTPRSPPSPRWPGASVVVGAPSRTRSPPRAPGRRRPRGVTSGDAARS